MFELHRNLRIVIPAVSTCVLIGCGGGGASDGTEETAAGESPEAAQQAAPAVDPATAATVTGQVVFEGTAPEMEAIDMSQEPVCAEKHPTPPASQEVVVNENGTLRNVFVRVTEGLDGTTFPTPSEPVVIDQDGCVYHPHVLGLQVGQALTIRNSDGILHNINATPSANRGFNISQPVDMESERTFGAPEVMIPVACDVHGWMQAYIGVVENPYYAVTGEDGQFTLENLPPGDYVVEAWHERYGTQTANVTVGPQQTQQIEFTFNESLAKNAVVPLADPIDLHDHDQVAAVGGR